MIPFYCGVAGEEKAGLNCGTENCWAVNAKASEEDQKATPRLHEVGRYL